MTEAFTYIENYFSGDLSEDEKRAFERRCEIDPAFAKEVGFYIATREKIQEELYSQKKKEFDALYIQLSSGTVPSSPLLRKLIPIISIAAAACLVLFIGWMVFFNSPSPRQLANNYIKDNLQTLSVTMNGREDSLQLGIAAFNKRDYALAEHIFRSIIHQGTLGPEVVKNLGIVYLVTDRYEQALVQFDSLSAYRQLYANLGPFYKAVTLMKRSEGKDEEEAKKILQEVIDKQLPGSQQAERWSRQW